MLLDEYLPDAVPLTIHLIPQTAEKPSAVTTMRKGAYLDHLAAHADRAAGIRRADLDVGDVILVFTRNSVYRVRRTGSSSFVVSGGWFDIHHGGEFRTSIEGCTWGGSCIHRDFLASPGMHMEFGNRVLTSAVERIVYIPAPLLN